MNQLADLDNRQSQNENRRSKFEDRQSPIAERISKIETRKSPIANHQSPDGQMTQWPDGPMACLNKPLFEQTL
jgi:hypothetical protein